MAKDREITKKLAFYKRQRKQGKTNEEIKNLWDVRKARDAEAKEKADAEARAAKERADADAKRKADAEAKRQEAEAKKAEQKPEQK